MGTISARLTLRAVENAQLVQTLEILADLQAFSFTGSEGLGHRIKEIYDELAKNYTQYDCRRIFRQDLVKFGEIIFGEIANKLGYI
jgi:histidine ammonia-lyase